MVDFKKITVICIIMIIGFVFAGCGDNGDTTEPAKSPYLGGTKGIVAEFIDMGLYNEDTRINEIYQDESFPIEIMLYNKGENDVEEGEVVVRLKGIYLPSFDGIVDDGELDNDELIEKIEETNEMGGEYTLDFTPGSTDAEYIEDFSGASVDFDIFAEIEYEYQTDVTIQKVCFKEDLQDDSICDIMESKSVYSSGAPIQATSAKEATSGSAKIAVTIEIQNMGNGDVAIIGDVFDKRYNKFTFESSDDDKWECRSGGKLNEGRFDSAGETTITCKLREQMEEDTLYTEDLGLTLEYKYRDLIQNSIRIKKE